MSLLKRSVRPARRFGLRRRRSILPILEDMESRVVLSSIDPSYFEYHPPGTYPSSDHASAFGALQEDNGSASPLNGSLGPQQLLGAYGLEGLTFGTVAGDGAGQTIAVVVAYDDPAFVDSSSSGFSSSDLARFDAAYGLPNPPSFTKVGQDGSTDLPGSDPSKVWGTAEAMDIEYAHAMAPQANLVVIETNFDPQDINQSLQDLVAGADTAAGLASVVGMSWGAPESQFGSSEPGDDASDFAGHPGVTFMASTGDGGATVDYPAASPDVVAVGGTSLSINADDPYGGEAAWSYGGGGASAYETEPSYQDAVQDTGARTVPDVSADADPATGVAVYDSFDNGSAAPWVQVGGTALSTSIWAGLIAVADQSRTLAGAAPLTGSSQTLPSLYKVNYNDFHDVLTGQDGNAAEPGYDEATGLGTPDASLLIPDLTAIGAASRMAVNVEPPSSVVAGDSFAIAVAASGPYGGTDTTYSGTATLSLTTNPGGASFAPIQAAFVHGQAVFSGVILDQPADGYQFTITSSTLGKVTTGGVDVTAGPGSTTYYYPPPTDAGLRAAILDAESDSSASDVVVLGAGAYTLTQGELMIQDHAFDGQDPDDHRCGLGRHEDRHGARRWRRRPHRRGGERLGASFTVAFQDLTITGGIGTEGGGVRVRRRRGRDDRRRDRGQHRRRAHPDHREGRRDLPGRRDADPEVRQHHRQHESGRCQRRRIGGRGLRGRRQARPVRRPVRGERGDRRRGEPGRQRGRRYPEPFRRQEGGQRQARRRRQGRRDLCRRGDRDAQRRHHRGQYRRRRHRRPGRDRRCGPGGQECPGGPERRHGRRQGRCRRHRRRRRQGRYGLRRRDLSRRR